MEKNSGNAQVLDYNTQAMRLFRISRHERINFKFGKQGKTSVADYEGWNFNSGNYLFTTDIK